MRIHKNGNIVFSSPVKMDDLSITHPLKIDTLKIKRIMASEGDSIISFGLSSLHYNQNTNNIYADPACQTYHNNNTSQTICYYFGMGIGRGSIGTGTNSIAIGNNANTYGDKSLAFGNNVNVGTTAANSIVIGSGLNFDPLNNNTPNSLVIGFNSDIPTVYVTPASGVGQTGMVGIGIDPTTQSFAGSNSDYKLLVGGAIGVHEAWVYTGNTWPDYVFEKDYKLKSLDELKKYFRVHKHMPHLPSAKEIKAKGAINIGEIQTNTVLEVEEIYLQLFILQDRIVKLEKQNALLVKLVSDKQ